MNSQRILALICIGLGSGFLIAIGALNLLGVTIVGDKWMVALALICILIGVLNFVLIKRGSYANNKRD